MTRRGNHRSAKKGNHRQPRSVKRPRVEPPRRSAVTFCLWSLGGELVKRFDGRGAPAFVMDEGIRYERMNPFMSGDTRHYQATVAA